MRDDDRVRILHMVDAAESVEQFAAGRKRGDLDTDRMLLFAIVRAIEVIGEAASKVTNETRAASPGIPWESIIGTRNRLIHGYFDIDLDIVWKTVTVEIPPLQSSLKQLLGKK
jgi:uncharacterized protein with HEPN domain